MRDGPAERPCQEAQGDARDSAAGNFVDGPGRPTTVILFYHLLRFAEYPFQPLLAGVGVVIATGALVMFHLTHRAMGRNWSVSLEVREQHKLVTKGIYRNVRHPMYTAFWMWALAQALLLPNWVAGLSGIIGFGLLYIFRVGHEERLMIETFGDHYLAYMDRTWRLFPGVY